MKKRYLLIIALVLLTNLITYLVVRKQAGDVSAEEQLTTLHKLDSLDLIISRQQEDYKVLGEENSELLELREELTESINELKKGVYKKGKKYSLLLNKVEQYEMMLRVKDEEIAKLKETAEELFEYNTELKGTISKRNDAIKVLEKERLVLSEKVKEAAVLNTINFSVVYANERGKVKEKQPFKAKDIDIIKVAWEFLENPVAESGQRKVYVILQDPSGAVISDNLAGGGTFEIDKQTYTYTKKVELEYDHRRKNLASIIYRNPQNFRAGTYSVGIYCDGHFVGKTAFLVK
ncbi:MAG: hypothetical protein AB8B61_06225 [Cyclobacteriaceae bacterium]